MSYSNTDHNHLNLLLRYQFSCIPANTTLLFLQHVHALNGLDAASWMMHSLPEPSIVGQYTHIGIGEPTSPVCISAADRDV